MDRRTFFFGLTLGTLGTPLPVGAQQAGKVFRIGILANVREGDAEGLWAAFLEGLHELGYVENQNIAIEWRVSEGRYERLPDLAAELVGRKVDVIVVPADQNALAAKQENRAIQIVVEREREPVRLVVVTSIDLHGGNRM